MSRNGIVFLAANTSRSQAYAQALVSQKHKVDTVIIFDKEDLPLPGKHHKTIQVAEQQSYADILLPDASIPLVESCNKLSDEVRHIRAERVNDALIYQAIKELSPELVIYSGFGGQIVSSELLALGAPFLHMHSGWLPDYRGSTTIYYSLLNEQRCGVSAIIMSPEIDMGSIVGRKYYPPPEPGMDIDYIYDSAIRADLLLIVFRDWLSRRSFKNGFTQQAGAGHNYYVIHPVLKHLAILSLDSCSKA